MPPRDPQRPESSQRASALAAAGPSADRTAADAGGPVAALPPAARDALAGLVAAARASQRAEVQRAIDAALGHVPALLRGAIRRILFS